MLDVSAEADYIRYGGLPGTHHRGCECKNSPQTEPSLLMVSYNIHVQGCRAYFSFLLDTKLPQICRISFGRVCNLSIRAEFVLPQRD